MKKTKNNKIEKMSQTIKNDTIVNYASGRLTPEMHDIVEYMIGKEVETKLNGRDARDSYVSGKMKLSLTNFVQLEIRKLLSDLCEIHEYFKTHSVYKKMESQVLDLSNNYSPLITQVDLRLLFQDTKDLIRSNFALRLKERELTAYPDLDFDKSIDLAREEEVLFVAYLQIYHALVSRETFASDNYIQAKNKELGLSYRCGMDWIVQDIEDEHIDTEISIIPPIHSKKKQFSTLNKAT